MQQKWKLKRNQWIGLGLALLFCLGGGIAWAMQAGRHVTTDDARVKGTMAIVSAKTPGRLVKVLVQEGEQVEAGQVVAEVEQEELALQVMQAKANLLAAQAKLTEMLNGSRPQQIAQANAGTAQAAANWKNAQKNADRMAVLYQQGAVSIQQWETAQTALTVAEAQYESAAQTTSMTVEGTRSEEIELAQAQVQLAQEALKKAELQLAHAVIKAPVSGIVATKPLSPGEYVAVGQSLCTIANLQDVWVSANIEEAVIGKIKQGQRVSVEFDAYPRTTFSGQVTEIGAATGAQFSLLPSENTSGHFTKVVQRIPIKIQVSEQAGLPLRPGMSAVVDVQVQ